MTNVFSSNVFNAEDKVCWEEWAPSLQDRLKGLLNKWYSGSSFIQGFLGANRLTIGPNPPSDPIRYCEIWWDTNVEALRVLTNSGWELMRATWYDDTNLNIADDIENPLSRNPRTRCHCYAINWNMTHYCHCKVQTYTAPSTGINTQTDMSFNKQCSKTYDGITDYRWIIAPQRNGVVISFLNARSADDPDKDSIIPLDAYTVNKVTVNGVQKDYVSYDYEKYAQMFSNLENSTCTFNTGTTYIPFTFAEPKKLTSIFGTLAPFSSGPVTITLQALVNNQWTTIDSITLKGNYQPGMVCHSNCHCHSHW